MNHGKMFVCDICQDEILMMEEDRAMIVDFTDEELEKEAPEDTSAKDIRIAIIESLERQGKEKCMEFAQLMREKEEFLVHRSCFDELNLHMEKPKEFYS
jgi:hypothetical protein